MLTSQNGLNSVAKEAQDFCNLANFYALTVEFENLSLHRTSVRFISQSSFFKKSEVVGRVKLDYRLTKFIKAVKLPLSARRSASR